MNSENNHHGRRLSPDQEDEIRTMWQIERKSATQIILALPNWSLTRSSVCALAFRRGWAGGQEKRRRHSLGPGPTVERRAPPNLLQISRGSSTAISHGARKRFAPTVPLPPEKVKKHSVFIADLKPHHCRWVKGEPKEFMYCGTRKEGRNSPYCSMHMRLSYVPRGQEPKKRAGGFHLPPASAPNF